MTYDGEGHTGLYVVWITIYSEKKGEILKGQTKKNMGWRKTLIFSLLQLYCLESFAKFKDFIDDIESGRDANDSYLMNNVLVYPSHISDDDAKSRQLHDHLEPINKSTTKFPEKFQVTLRHHSEKFTLKTLINDLSINNDLKVIYHTPNGIQMTDDTKAHECRYYQGSVIDAPNTKATLSLCNKGIEGVVDFKGMHYYIFPVNDSVVYFKAVQGRQGVLLGPHYVLRKKATHLSNTTFSCVSPQRSEVKNISSIGRNRMKRSNSLHLTETKYVELYIVNDKSEYQWLGNDVQNNVQRMKLVANIMDSIYKPLNVRIILKAVEVWNDTDKIAITADITKTMNTFLKYRYNNTNSILYNDNAQLVTHVDFTGVTIGLAPVSTMCRAEYSGSVNQDISKTEYARVAITMAHEMGHNLGMEHDSDQCTCADVNGYCIMAAKVRQGDPISTTFSSCSKSYFQTYLNQQLGGCMLNKPTEHLRVGNTQCGNNVVDPGEDCDCGLVEACKNPCCNPSTCKLKPGANCAAGKCCDDCNFKRAGRVCRYTGDLCDLPESCSGTSGDCPKNIYKQDGTDCDGNTGYCYEGICRSHSRQCKELWGSDTNSANSLCFTTLNTIGDEYGNCGKFNTGYSKCTRENAKCGLLHCVGMSKKFPVIGFSRHKAQVSFYAGGNQIDCYSGKANLGQQQPNPGEESTSLFLLNLVH